MFGRSFLMSRFHVLRWASTLLIHAALSSSGQQGGITNEGPFTVFGTDTNDALLSLSLPFDVPGTNLQPRLDFIFGFSTDEPAAPGTFYDSFSVTVQNSNQTATTFVLTADRSGVDWAPASPGGLTVAPGDLRYVGQPFPAQAPQLNLSYAYAVSFLLPPELTGIVTLFFDLFNNLNQFASLAFVSGVHIDTNQVVPPASLVLQSSASVAGPFADESGVTIDTTNQVLTLPQFGAARFFRMQPALRAPINQLRIEGDQLVFPYTFQPTGLVLQSAQSVIGPYTDETNAVLDLAQQTISLPHPSGAQFYRIRSDPQVVITAQGQAGGLLILHFEPRSLVLQSSAAVPGPYADETGVTPELANHLLKIPKLGRARFYRLRADQPMELTNLIFTNGFLVLHYQ
jgi:hypothetical protein